MDQEIDGFRVDLVASLVKADPDKKATIALWQDLNAWFEKACPHGVLIAAWFNDKESLPAHFDVDFLRRALFACGRGANSAPDSLYLQQGGQAQRRGVVHVLQRSVQAHVEQGLPLRAHG